MTTQYCDSIRPKSVIQGLKVYPISIVYRALSFCVSFLLFFFVAKKLSFSCKILYTHTQSFGDDRVITANGNKIRGVFIKISSEFLIENTLFFSRIGMLFTKRYRSDIVKTTKYYLVNSL